MIQSITNQTKNEMKKVFALFVFLMVACRVCAALEYRNTTYDFLAISSADKIVMSNTSYSAADGGSWGAVFVATSVNGNDAAKLAFRYSGASAGNYSWWYRDYNGNKGLYHGDSGKPAPLAILGLRAGDIVTINCTNNNNLQYVKFDGNVHAVYGSAHDDFYTQGGNTAIQSGRPIHITSDGDLILRNYGDNYITSIQIQAVKNAAYTITKNSVNKTTFAFTRDGLMDYNDVAVPYMRVSFGHSRNFIMINNLQSSIYDWTEKEDLTLDGNNIPFSGNYYAFTPTGNGTVTLNGSCNGTVYLFKIRGNEYQWVNGNPYIASYSGQSTIQFNVENGYTYYICEDNRSTHGNAFHLQSFTFQNTFYLDRLAVVVDSAAIVSAGASGSINLTSVHGDNGLTIDAANSYVKRTSERIKGDGNGGYSNIQVGVDNGQLTVRGIEFDDAAQNCGGTVIYHLATNQGVADFVITIPYSAGWGVWDDGYGKRTWGHVWHFADPRNSDSGHNSTGLLDIGQASNSSSLLAQEIAKREWLYAQRITGTAGGFHDPMYTNVFDIEGDNADMIWETEGLWFDTESNLSCLWNEGTAANYSSSSSPDRYVGLLPPESGTGAVSSFTIPGLKDGDRVEIYLGSGEASGTDIPYFTIEGAKDALGTPITQTYGFGGSMWDLAGSSYDYRSCYQFIKDGNGNMKFSLTNGSMAKIYSIHIYRGEKSYQNNVTRKTDGVDGYQLLNTYKTGDIGADGIHYQYQLHFRGKGESLYGQPEVLAQSGVLDLSPERLWYTTDGHIVNYKSRIGDYGAFRMRLKCANFNGNYVADYADQTLSVGYLEKKAYPYTWDFTDLKSWIDDYAQARLQNEWTNAAKTDDYKWVWIWRRRIDAETNDEAYGLNVNHNSDRNVTRDQIRASGGQLYVGDLMVEETRGLGIETVNYDKNYNDRLCIMSDGLNISGLTQNTWTIRIPEVDDNATVYVRGKKLGTLDDSHAEVLKCTVGSGERQDFPAVIEIANDKTGETVFAVKNSSGAAQDMRLTFNRLKVKRIAVATDEKKVNVKGYASESRTHAIDASLLPYFTGQDMKTYIVSNPDYSELTVDLTDIGVTANYVMPANTGCVIFNNSEENDKSFDVFADGKGFHLFVPDMHDTTGKMADVSTNNTLMVPVPSDITVPDTYNYITLTRAEAFNASGAVWFAYTWNNSAFTSGSGWIPEVNGKFVGLKPGDNFVFVRMNPEGDTNWDYKWNQSIDLTVPTEGNGANYIIDTWNYSNSGKMGGYWHSNTAEVDDMTNYVLTYRYKKLNGNTLSGTQEGDEKFYRVYSGSPVKLRPNSSYMVLPTDEVKPATAALASQVRLFSFNFHDVYMGDVNTDRAVNVTDFISVANDILGSTPEWYNAKAADINGDNDINVADFIGVANIILNGNAANGKRAAADTSADVLYAEPLRAEPGTQQVVSVRLKNAVPMVGYEFSIVLPEGVTIAREADGCLMAQLSEERTTERHTNFFDAAMMGNGQVKVLCGTTAAQDGRLCTFDDNDGEVARLIVNVEEGCGKGLCEVTFADAKYTDQTGTVYHLGSMATAIQTVEADMLGEGAYYTLSGQKLSGRPTQRGIYIVNGNKVLVK